MVMDLEDTLSTDSIQGSEHDYQSSSWMNDLVLATMSDDEKYWNRDFMRPEATSSSMRDVPTLPARKSNLRSGQLLLL